MGGPLKTVIDTFQGLQTICVADKDGTTVLLETLAPYTQELHLPLVSMLGLGSGYIVKKYKNTQVFQYEHESGLLVTMVAASEFGGGLFLALMRELDAFVQLIHQRIAGAVV